MLKRVAPDKINPFREYIRPTDAKCIAAIDFGTYKTSYAFAYPGKGGITDARDSIFSNGPWADGKYGKTETAVLLDENNKFIAFGKSAQTKYQDIVMKCKVNGSEIKDRYFEHFKRNLYKPSVRGYMLISAANGIKVAAKTVLSESLKYIKHSLLAQINRSTNDILECEIKWIITVPVIWSDAEKQVMRDAAELADLKGYALQLVLEPDAAFLWTFQSNNIGLNLGSMHMVCNCSRESVDVTVHEVNLQPKIKEVIPAYGGNWGSTAINWRVLKLLEEIFGRHRYQNMTRDPSGFAKIQEDIEMAKIAFDEDSEYVLVVPDFLTANTHEDTITAIEATERYSMKHNVDLRLVGQNLLVPNDYFYKTCMEPTINRIVEHVRGILTQHKGISKISLVGGFSNSRKLQSRFAREFGKARIIVLERPGEAIVKGAVLLGADTGFIAQQAYRSRVEQMISTFSKTTLDESESLGPKERASVVSRRVPSISVPGNGAKRKSTVVDGRALFLPKKASYGPKESVSVAPKEPASVVSRGVPSISVSENGENKSAAVIDRRVLRLLEKLFGEHRYRKMVQDPIEFTRILENIKIARITFDANIDISLALPDLLTEDTYYDDVTASEAIELYSSVMNVDFQLTGQNLLIPAEYFLATCMTIDHRSANMKRRDCVIT
ncbi:hypothetical protein K7432_004900 [Basidiobolus ranarum]|uniref:Uncharacterized protein n=1 Tax=Basidiobolus ranarum TaxID=34480 RepID=A0ABR2WXI1_9FUNG